MDRPDAVAQLQKQLETARRELHNLRQEMVALKHVHRKELAAVSHQLKDWECQSCRLEKREEPAAAARCDFECTYVGYIESEFSEKRGTPRQATICPEMRGKLTLSPEVFTNPEHSLEGLGQYSHMWIVFYFDRHDGKHVRAKVAPPRLNGERTGVFSTRSPHRPNAIGLSLVRISKIEGSSIYFTGVDMLDGTPVLDIKPYIPNYDDPSFPLPIEPQTSPLPSSSSELSTRVLDGEENRQPVTTLDNRSSPARMGEREAPDGEEEEEENARSNVRVAPWIGDAPVKTLKVEWRERALRQLAELEAEPDKKRSIDGVLREDPRSVYLRGRWGVGQCYVFRIAELHVSCKFDDAAGTVAVFRVVKAEGPEEEAAASQQ